MPKSALWSLTVFFALVSAMVSPAIAQPAPETASFTVSQLGHAVGTADFHYARTAAGFDATSTVRVHMQGLDYSLSKTEQLDPNYRILHVILSATVNGAAVNVTGKLNAGNFLLNTSANGRSATTRLAAHKGEVLLPDFDPGGLQTLLTMAPILIGRDLWVILPKKSGSTTPVQVATYADERGAIDGKLIAVHHLVATFAGSHTDLFTGPDSELLQAELPQQGFSLIHKGFVLTPPAKPGAPPAE